MNAKMKALTDEFALFLEKKADFNDTQKWKAKTYRNEFYGCKIDNRFIVSGNVYAAVLLICRKIKEVYGNIDGYDPLYHIMSPDLEVYLSFPDEYDHLKTTDELFEYIIGEIVDTYDTFWIEKC